MGMSHAGTYARSINAAATVISGQDTSDDSTKDVAATVIDLAEKLYKQQLKSIDKLDITEDSPSGGARSKFTGKPRSSSGGSGSSGGGLSEKQEAAVDKALASLGDETPYTKADILAASGDGGPASERSGMIGKVFDAAWGGRG